jgi:hypothetical protein
MPAETLFYRNGHVAPSAKLRFEGYEQILGNMLTDAHAYRISAVASPDAETINAEFTTNHVGGCASYCASDRSLGLF